MKLMLRYILKSNYLLLSLCLLVSCSNSSSYEDALNTNRKRIEDPKKLEDANFLVEVKSLTLLQLQLLKLAPGTGYSSAIVNIGKNNIEGFTKMNDALNEIAKSENITLPDEMSESHQQMYKEIQRLDKGSFDQRFIAVLKNINDTEQTKFTHQATEGYDPDIRAFAARQVGLLRTHQENIFTVEQGLLQTVPE